MKSLAKMYVWPQDLENDIEDMVHLCDECQHNQANITFCFTEALELAIKASD